jgi:N utilization substance protein B
LGIPLNPVDEESDAAPRFPAHPKSAGRAVALQYLYMRESQGEETAPSFDDFLKALDEKPNVAALELAGTLVAAVLEHGLELDADIGQAGANWRLERMGLIERNVLRLGLVELRLAPDTPFKIVMDEAVELAKRFSGEEAGAFVNGVLDAVRRKDSTS